MKHEPPVPAANQSPYPIAEPRHAVVAPGANLPVVRAGESRGKTLVVAGGTVARYGAAVALAVGAALVGFLFSKREAVAPEPKIKAGKRKKKHGKGKRS